MLPHNCTLVSLSRGGFTCKTPQTRALSTFCAQNLEMKPAGISGQIGGLSHHMNVHVITHWAAKAHCSLSVCVEESQGGSDLFAGMQRQSCGEI